MKRKNIAKILLLLILLMGTVSVVSGCADVDSLSDLQRSADKNIDEGTSFMNHVAGKVLLGVSIFLLVGGLIAVYNHAPKAWGMVGISVVLMIISLLLK